MWSEQQIKYLIENYHDTDNKILSQVFDKTVGAITTKANGIGLKKDRDFMTTLKKKNNPGVIWSDQEISILKHNYKDKSYPELSEELNKSKKAILKKLKKMGLSKDRIKIVISNNKKRGRDLSFEQVKDIASAYDTITEFFICDPSACNKAYKKKWIDEISKHMIVKSFSIPQLILKDILEFILNEKCSYNDRKIIYPLEIDCYFSNWKIGWEYDGKYFHDGINRRKVDICQKNNILLLVINENADNYRNYEKNIKKQLIDQLVKINNRTSLNITASDIENYIPKIIYPNLLTVDEKTKVLGKKMSQIKKTNKQLFHKIKKYKLYEQLDIINDIKPQTKPIRSLTEYLVHIKSKNIKTYSELIKSEHPHRIMKRLNIPLQQLKDCFPLD